MVSYDIAELSTNEKKLLLVLKDAPDKRWYTEDVLAKGDFKKLVEVMNAASWLHAKRLIDIKTEIDVRYSLTSEGIEYVNKGLPERRIIDLLKSKGELKITDLYELIPSHEVAYGIGHLKKYGIKVEKSTIKVGDTSLPDIEKGILEIENVLNVILQKKVCADAEIKFEIALHFLKRGILKKHEITRYSFILTDSGKEILQSLKEVPFEITQLTPHLIKSGKWRSVKIRKYDIHTFAPAVQCGRLHPITELVEKIRMIFIGMGFKEIEYDYIQPCFWNMDALYVPQDHPARDMQDTFYMATPSSIKIDNDMFVKKVKAVHEKGRYARSKGWGYKWCLKDAEKAILRTHTTVNTIRYLAEHPEPPVKVFTVGFVFRNEELSYKNIPEFIQIEGILMERNASFGMLIGLLKEFYSKMGFANIKVRPSYFPFTEPSLEVAVEYKNKWLEFGGAGIFRPEVTAPFNIKYPVLAWGLGLERLAMLLHELDDIRKLYYSELDWLRRRKAVCD
jgi:phenylalanyl-tRNA synthetase alpha chain